MTHPQTALRLLMTALLMLAHATVAGAAADLSVDPTRPPNVNASPSGDEKPAHARVLQSVLIAPGRSVAVIDGETVRVGGRVGEAKVIRIDESGVTLAQSGKTEILTLFPDAKKSVPRHSVTGQRSNEARVK